jgi:hypothetical protein
MNGYQELDGLFRGHFPLQFDNLDDLGVPHGTPILGMKQIIRKRWAQKKNTFLWGQIWNSSKKLTSGVAKPPICR